MHDAERAHADYVKGLPPADQCGANAAAAETYRILGDRMAEFAGRCSQESDRLGDEVRRLEAHE